MSGKGVGGDDGNPLAHTNSLEQLLFTTPFFGDWKFKYMLKINVLQSRWKVRRTAGSASARGEVLLW